MKLRKDDDRKPVEQEVAELQRKFRVLENDKRAFSEDSQSIIRKQRESVEKLTRENRGMKQELNDLRRSDRGGPEARRAAETLQDLQEGIDALEKKMNGAVSERNVVDEKLQLVGEKTMEIRSDLGAKGGVNAAQNSTAAVNKQIRVLENRLDKSLQKFNEAVAENKRLREKIDSLRKERVVFDNIYKKLENEFEAKKKEMANIIEQANAAYEARDAAQAQITNLKQQADKEHAEFEKEWKELGRLIENDKKMKEFMRNKEKDRVKKEEKEGEGSPSESTKLRKNVTKNAWSIAKGKVTAQTTTEKIGIYEEAFTKIQAATGISDIDDLVQNFINAEDSNFSLFNYANLLSAEIEKLEAEIEVLKEECNSLSKGPSGAADVKKQAMLATIEEKWNRADKKAEHYELKFQQGTKTLTAVRAGIQSIYNRIGCNTMAGDHQAMLGPSGVTENNMLAYIAVIEQRANEILMLSSGLNTADEDDTAAPKADQPLSQLQIKLPSTVEDDSGDDEDDEDDDQRPFTKEELKLKSERQLQRKNKRAGGKR